MCICMYVWIYNVCIKCVYMCVHVCYVYVYICMYVCTLFSSTISVLTCMIYTTEV